MTVTLELVGFDDMEAALDQLPQGVRKGGGRRAMLKAAQPMADLAAALAPRDSGDLAASITVSTKLDRRQAREHRREAGGDRAFIEVFVGPSYDLGAGGRHGHLVEFGTVHSAPQPFMRPAWDQDQRAMLERLKVDLWAEIKKSLARAEAKAARLAAQG